MKNKLFVVFVILFLNVNCAESSDDIQNTGSDVTIEAAQEALDFHNDVRSDVGVSELVWSNELAEYAQEWADYLANENDCTMAHRSAKGMNPKGYGENIFWGYGKSYTPLDASESWYSEIDKYVYTEVTSDNYQDAGHYTQMVWKDTKEVGIGIAICPDGATIIVANYDPPGNYIGQKPY